MSKDYPLSKQEFDAIYSKVPRLCVDIIIKSPKGVLLTKRNIEPCKGMWHLPGGTVFYGEKLKDAVKRVALRELGLKVTSSKFIGYVEYPSHYENGLDSPVSMVFEAIYSGEVKLNKESKDWGWFNAVPANTHPEQDVFLEQQVL